MDTTGPLPTPEATPADAAPVARRRGVRLGIAIALLAVPVAVIALGIAAPVSGREPIGVEAVGGEGSGTSSSIRTLVAPTSSSVVDVPSLESVQQAALRLVPPTTSTTTSTTTATTTTSTTAPPTTTTTAPLVTTTTAPAPVAAASTAAAPAPANRQSGQATWYRWKAGNCAHNTLPKGTVLTVTNTATGASTTCTVGDRGAFRYPTIVDLDASVFSQIAPLGAGRISVTITW